MPKQDDSNSRSGIRSPWGAMKKYVLKHERDARMRRFLRVYSKTANGKRAAAAAAISRRTWYEWRDKSIERPDDPDYQLDGVPFAELLERAADDAGDALEEEAWRRAVEGVDKPLIGTVTRSEVVNGKVIERRETGVVGTVKEFSDRILELLLKGAKPAKYRENPRLNVAVATKVEINNSSRERLAAKLMDVLDRREKAQITDGAAVVDAVPSEPAVAGSLVSAKENSE
jgi:hypothetical protein